ncbi:sigma-54-dependent transcriptional regulator [Vulgatibacter incomptus]|uniref:Type IV fimbriae expression regulatory protein PilR n=1 Tax=Vulgatibacter incomptus TaxID=1391653 RepID=A0A0K1PA77_9BACT|nr:sigma-54 dependent transcriptional regulator [Vulgatibacter incomptus]AKU90316.1 Type IV fimbriae expression regulatory protein PilR [Vulgatibacter incomptus]
MGFREILIVDDEESMRHMLLLFLRQQGYEARAASSAAEALAELEARDYDAVVTDVRMPGDDGIALVRKGLAVSPETSFLVMSAYGTEALALEAMKAGAVDYVSKPFRPDELVLKLRMAAERAGFQREVRRLKAELREERGLDALVGESPAMQELARQLRKIAPVKTTVLVTGESGTGKELVARAIHELSPRREKPFVAVNCGAIPETLMESELFGFVKGAFTGAVKSSKGLFAEADGGTIFLDEVAELPPPMQVKLLRVLQEEEVRPVGEARSFPVDVRVVAATRKDLRKASADGSFREDLFYRLHVVGLELPPLRERPTDIPALVEHFVAKYNARLRRQPPIRDVTSEAMDALRRHPWPGNVRELENAIERALVLSEGDCLGPDAFVFAPQATDRAGGSLVRDDETSIKRATRRIEEELIRRALEQTGGNRTRAAEVLEISHRALLYKLKEFGIR